MNDQLSSDLASLRIARDAPPAGGKGLRYTILAVVAAGAALALYAIGLPYFEARMFKPEVELTEILMVSPAQSSVELTSAGYVIAEKTSKVAAKVPGRIAKISVEEGAQVKTGDVIAELDDVDQVSSLAAARSRVAALRARALASDASLAEEKIK